MSGTVQLYRVFTAPPERVYRAFTDPDALVKWMPPHGFIGKVQSMDVHVEGTYKMSFTNFSTKSIQSFGGKYTEVKPNQLLKYIDKFDDPNLPGEMYMTVSFREVKGGTEVKITQEGIPDAIPVEMCYVGWQQSLHLLAHVVEPNILDEM
jgi:uncharacterized protein YndB with AHSA1/START domain